MSSIILSARRDVSFHKTSLVDNWCKFGTKGHPWLRVEDKSVYTITPDRYLSRHQNKPPSWIRCHFLSPDRNDHSNSPQLSVKTGSSIISTRRKNGYHVAHCCIIRSFTFLPDFHTRQHETKILGKEETSTANSSLNANAYQHRHH